MNRFSPSDAVLWQIERDPLLRSTITAVALLDRAPDWDRLVAKIERATYAVPRLRARVVEPTWQLGAPRWEPVDDVDLGYHLRRVVAPAPGKMQQVLDLAQPIAMASFDPARPLWELTLVEGLRDGQAALIQKFHHCLTDGVGGIELALSMLDTTPDAPDPRDEPIPVAPRRAAAPGGSGPLHAVDHVVGAAWRVPRTTAKVALGASTAAIEALADPIGTAASVRDVAGVFVRTLAPVSGSPGVSHERGLSRRLHTIEVPMADLHDAGHASGGTVNDAFLAAVIEGLRRYHSRHGLAVEELSITMPINVRQSGDDPGGNQFSPARFTVPANVSDPIQRMQRLGHVAREWHDAPVRQVSGSIAFVLDKLPRPITTAILASMLTSIDTVITNVPGWSEPMYLVGARVERQFGFAPTSGAAVNVALLSHESIACIGIEVDMAAVPDDDVLLACLIEGFRDVVRVVDRDSVISV